MSKDSNEEVTVRDRRMFNPDGTLRQQIVESAPEIPAPKAAEEVAKTEAAPVPEIPETPEEEVPAIEARERPTGVSQDFTNLIGMLTTNAILHLGVDPQFGQGQIDIETARHFIDMLSMLQDKTAGNLSIEEEHYLNEMIGRLRMEYMSIVNQMSKSVKSKA